MHTCISPQGPFATLPKELYILISEFLQIPDLNAFSRTSTATNALLNAILYKRDATSPTPTSLFWASIHNNPATALKSLSAGYDITSKTDSSPRLKGCTPVLLASFHNSLAVLKLLLLSDEATPNSRDRKYIRPPLSWAVIEGHTEIVKTLLNDDRTDVNLQDKHGDTSLMIAVNSQPKMVTLLLCGGGADPRIANRQGRTPLSRAARNAEGEVGLLLAQHLRLILDGDNAAAHCQHVFFYAAIMGHVDIVKYLVTYFGEKLDPNADGQQYGRGAFTIAADGGWVDVVTFLLDWTVTEPNLQTHWRRRTPLYVAAEAGKEDIVEALIGCERVGLEIPDVNGTTPLGIAADRNHEGVVRLLLGASRPADPNARDEDGQTPLFNAAFYGHLRVVELLLNAPGIDLQLERSDGKTALQIALENGNQEVVEVLQRHIASSS
jgi:ankyrin repeat protein